jgi:hypothetical protein
MIKEKAMIFPPIRKEHVAIFNLSANSTMRGSVCYSSEEGMKKGIQ